MHPFSEDRPPVHTVVIRLRLEGELPSGRATGHDGAERPFTGWLGLMGAIQALIVEDDGPGSERDLNPGCPGSDPADSAESD